MDEATFKQQLSNKLKQLRGAKGMELVVVAASSGVPRERLEEYEQGQSLPAVGELMNLAAVYDVSLNHFFTSEIGTAQVEVVRAGERWKVEPQSDTAASLNYSYEALSYRLTDKTMSPFHVEIPPNEGGQVQALSHEGEEFHFILSGQVEIAVGEETHHLGAGDAIYFDSRLPHTVRALGSRSAKMLACLVNVHRAAAEESPLTRAH